MSTVATDRLRKSVDDSGDRRETPAYRRQARRAKVYLFGVTASLTPTTICFIFAVNTDGPQRWLYYGLSLFSAAVTGVWSYLLCRELYRLWNPPGRHRQR